MHDENRQHHNRVQNHVLYEHNPQHHNRVQNHVQHEHNPQHHNRVQNHVLHEHNPQHHNHVIHKLVQMGHGQHDLGVVQVQAVGNIEVLLVIMILVIERLQVLQDGVALVDVLKLIIRDI